MSISRIVSPIRTILAGSARTSIAAAVMLFVVLSPATAASAENGDSPSTRREVLLGSTVRVTGAAHQTELSNAPAWQAFRGRYGEWSSWWNELTGTPHRASGPAIALEGFAADSASVDRALRSFIAEQPEVFLDPVLETVAVQLVRGTWYARYRQLLGGVPVLLSDWEFRVSEHGRLFMFGADAYRTAHGVAQAPGMVPAVAREAARREIEPQGVIEGIAGGDCRALLPVARGAAVAFRLVYDFRVRTSDPAGTWAVMVDATTGEIVQRQSLTRRAIEGRVSGSIHARTPTEMPESRDFTALKVAVGADTSVTDSLGRYHLGPDSGTITAGLYGAFVDVNRDDGPDASQSIAAPGSGTYDLAWSDGNSVAPERDAYYHVNLAHAYIKRLDPGLVRLDRPVPCVVNKTGLGACNAEWDGHGLIFLPGDATCQNSASTAGIVYHEYGHGVTNEVFRQAANDPLAYVQNGVIDEGSAELNEMFIQDDPIDARDFYGPGTFDRKDDVEARWPEDQSGIVYNTMFILTGAFWELRLDVGKEVAERLCHFARYGMPDDPDDGIALSEYFLDALVADDDDADLSNGTPHLAAMLRAFNPRGLGTSYFFAFDHVPLADQSAGGAPIPVTTAIQYVGPFGALDPASPTLFYSINGAVFVATAMTPTGTPEQFTAAIPAPDGAVVRYYLRAEDSFGGVVTRPVGAPARRPYAFVNGLPAVIFADDMEADRGWTVGAPDDSATGGIWVRGDPNGTNLFDPIQPADDHTPGFGVQCWVTGNNPNTGSVNRDDVDGGRTSLTSPRLDASAIVNPVIEYYRWYTNRVVREPETDYWRVLLSNDGGASWVAVENTPHSENRWERILVRIGDYMPPTTNMRIRFVARDSMGNSTVEAALDDFRLFGFAPTAVLLSRFEAEPLPDAIEIRWQFSATSDPVAARLERSPDPSGPWVTCAAEQHGVDGLVVVRDREVEPSQTYYYRLVAADPAGGVHLFGPLVVTASATITRLAIEGIAPNPSPGVSRISFAMPHAGHVLIRVFDPAGREIARLVDGPLSAGHHEVTWSGEGPGVHAASGLYFVRLEVAGASSLRRIALIR